MAQLAKTRSSSRWWLSAAAILVLVGAAFCQPAALARTVRSARPMQPLAPGAPPALQVGPASDVDALWEHGRQLARRGEYAAAATLYGEMADRLGEAVAPRALLLRARAALSAGDTEGAADALDRLLGAYDDSDRVPGALFTLARVRQAAGDCPAALEALDAFQARAGEGALGPYLPLQRAACYAELQDSDNQLAAAQEALAIDGGGPRLARIDALERAAEAALKLGRHEEALGFYDQTLALAATRSYRSELLFTTAAIARALGRVDLAGERFRAVVVDFADQPRATEALEALAEMGRAATISPYQAGLVHLNTRDYPSAQSLFEQVDPADPQAGPARFNRAVSLLRQGYEDEAVAEMRALAAVYPAQAPAALLRAGRVLESNGKSAEAAAAFEELLQRAPDSQEATTARLRLAFTRYVRDDLQGALQTWQAALDPSRSPAPAVQAQAFFWRGKAFARLRGPSSADAHDAWTKAAAVAPDDYYGLRARDLLAGAAVPTARPPTHAGVQSERTPAEERERVEWFAQVGQTPAGAEEALATDAGLTRAEELLDLGLGEQAGWEIEAAMKRFTDAADTRQLAALGDWLAEHDLPQLTLQVGLQERGLLGGLAALPRSGLKQVYPAGWGDIAREQARARGVDPLLLLALVRQESGFDARAQSSANALGLTQVIPPTARDIARQLGRSATFQVSDLFKPGVSLEFGAVYLAHQLEHYGGRVLPALAGYNAGNGNADSWLAAWGNDPDVFVEQIPFAETQHYVKVVYENYRHYLELYGN